MAEAIDALRARWAEFAQLAGINAVLEWDLQTYMPPGGAQGRSEQMGALSKLTHDMLTSAEMGRAIEAAERQTAGLDPDSDEVRLVANARRDYDHATKIPSELAAEITRHTTLAQELWARCRVANDFAGFAPSLARTFELADRVAGLLGYEREPYDALLDQFERGARADEVAQVFAELKPRLVALARAIADARSGSRDASIAGPFPAAAQAALTRRITTAMGYDLQHGRQDLAPHPFCATLAPGDVRITTRFDEAVLEGGLYSSMHEAGHALYDQGLPAAWAHSPLDGGASMGVHESQSRMWENLVGRSRAFCEWVLPLLRETFPEAFAGVTAERLYRSVNCVEPSLVRTEADEVTYNLHVLLRFEMERDLLAGRLRVEALPAAWNARMEEYLGVTPPDDADGVLQDVHWAAGLVGYFPTYTLGNVISGQLWHTARQALPDLEGQIAQGEFAPLLGWLRENVHRHGCKYTPQELVRRATGEPLTAKYYLGYLERKYGELYGV